jgi:predicted dehydrogenase
LNNVKKIGVMGYGVVASYGHVPAIHQTDGLELVSIYDPDPARLAQVDTRGGSVRTFTGSEAFFQSGIDAVVIASPAPCHLQNVRAAARYGKHVLCEKPLAMTDGDAQEMIGIMQDAGLMLFTGFCYRFSDVSLKIKELVEQKAVGDIRSLRLIYIWNLHGKYEWTPDGERVDSPRRVGRMLEGGPMVDCGVHQIDLARWWLQSDIVRAQGIGVWVEDYPSPDHMYLHLDHASGAHTMVEMSFSYCHTAAEPIDHFSYHLIGTDGLIRYDRHGWHFEVRNSHGTWYPGGADEKNFAGMHAAFARALETGDRGYLASGQDGVLATRIARTATEEVIAHRLARK